MKLPLDNFEILGVNPGTSARDILMMLERKLEHCEYSGFENDTLQRRSRLLNNACQTIMDSDRRKEADASYRNNNLNTQSDHGIIIESGDENAGLLLLLEAGHYEECLSIANGFLTQVRKKSRQENDSNDTSKVIGYATLEYNSELKSKRYFDSCARVLEKGLEVVRNQAGCTTIERRIHKELEDIVPFRILDLVSRDMGEPTREEGIAYLVEFINRRGGLDSESNLYIENTAFRSFFRQIRYFLTVQEQIDLYQEWCHQGCDSACFLLGISLVASGFARRKPERLIEALAIMKSLQSQDLEELIEYISLLLGKVTINEKRSRMDGDSLDGSNDKESALAELCNSCREWLIRDVLEGYRDVEASADLEAYFSDRDVTSFIEEQDKDTEQKRNQQKNRLAPLEMGQWFLEKSSSKQRVMQVNADEHPAGKYTSMEKIGSHAGKHRNLSMKWLISGLLLMLITVSLALVAKQKGASNNTQPEVLPSKTVQRSPKSNDQDASRQTVQPVSKNRKLGSQEVSEQELASILAQWLNIKQEALMSYDIPTRVSDVATPEAKVRLSAEVYENKTKGIKQVIDVKVKDLRIQRREKERIETIATLVYSDKSTDQRGVIIERTPKHMFEKAYIFLYKQGYWVVQ